MKKLAIFDLDGTLFDTVPANHAAYNAVLMKHGFSISEAYFRDNCNGRHYSDFLPEIIGENPSLTELIHDEKIRIYPEFYGKIRENTALFALLRALRDDYHTALVTTAAEKSVYAILEMFGRTDDFDLILTQADVKNQKPAPDGFIMAMEHFGVPSRDTIIFEDSPGGIAAAESSGAQYFIIKNIV